MTLWTSSTIATAVKGSCLGQWQASGVAIDSRHIKAGDLFIPLKGPHFDGHDFILDALNKGAAGAITEKEIKGAAPEKLVRVADSFKALAMLGAAGRARAKAYIIAITGSVGKTGCKEVLRQLLALEAETYANEGSLNNHWGVPLSLARLPETARFGIFEIGMNHGGELGPLSRQVRPHSAMITTIAAVHIGNFANLDGIAAAKAEIMEGVLEGGHAILNADNSYFDYLKERAGGHGIKNIHGFGKAAQADARIDHYDLGADSSVVAATILGQKINYRIGVAGEHWVFNSACILLATTLAGAPLDKMAAGLGHLSLATGRGVPHTITIANGSFTLIDESYNASPIAVEMAIKVLARKTGRRLLALGDMRELGEHSRAMHLGLKDAIMAADIAKVFCCGEHMKHLYDALPHDKRGAYAFTAKDLVPHIVKAMQAGDIITVKGSNSVGMKTVVEALKNMSLT